VKATYDAAWRERALAGDPGAVAALADEAIGPLYQFCLYRVGRDRHLSEEVVQETLVQAMRDLRKYEPSRAGNNIYGWLQGIARNQVQRVLGREKGAVSLETLWARMDKELLEVYARLDSEPFGDELLEREETREMVNVTMSQLPPHYREALEAKYVRGRSVKEMAAEGRMSEKATESLLTRAREAFRVTFLALARNLNVDLSAEMIA
jgi:RNA polymerase sigma-70 factor (ECF subfamily)